MNTTFEVYGKIGITPYPLSVIREYKVSRGLNKHDEAMIKGIIDPITLSQYQYLLGSNTCVTLYCQQENKRQLLFSGFLEHMEIYEVGEQREVILKLSGLTRALDREEKLVDYQAENKMLSNMIDNIMEGYKKVCYDCLCENKNIPDFLLQYEETDYEFLKRVLSKEKAPIFTALTGNSGKICFGKGKDETTIVKKETDYQVIFDKGLYYRLKSRELYDLGMKIQLNEKKLIVKEAGYTLVDGEFQNEYVLCHEWAFEVGELSNAKATGISLDGIIQERQRDKVKIQLNQTPVTEKEKLRWFGYSSPAASSDGSGWYCMPEIGEEIRLYCPTEDEKEAYVISAIRSSGENKSSTGKAGGGSGQGAKEPTNKSLSNVQGQSVDFTPEGVNLTCAGGVASMMLSQNGEIIIAAENTIELLSEENIAIRAEQGIVVMGTDTISLINDAGSSVKMEDTITLDANRIKNNC